MVRGAALGHRGRLQNLRGEFPQRRATASDTGGGAGIDCARAETGGVGNSALEPRRQVFFAGSAIGNHGTGFLMKNASRPARHSSMICGAAVYSVILIAIACPENLHSSDLVVASAFGALVPTAAAPPAAVSITPLPAPTSLI